MRESAWIGVLSLVGCLSTACGGGGGVDRGCNHPGTGVCFENWQAPPGAKMSWNSVQEGCTSLGGVWEPCPASGRAGVCTGTFEDGSSLDLVFYVGLVCSDAEGEARCQEVTGPSSLSYAPGGAHCGPASPHSLACDFPSAQACSSAAGEMSSERIAVLGSECTAGGGTLVDACGTAGRIATCAFIDAADLTMLVTYYSVADLEQARTSCTGMDGTFTDYSP
jgi:hypothetical protein